MSDELSFKVSMLGPTRVGKTSIIASMLQGGQQLLTGTPVTMPLGEHRHGSPDHADPACVAGLPARR